VIFSENTWRIGGSIVKQTAAAPGQGLATAPIETKRVCERVIHCVIASAPSCSATTSALKSKSSPASLPGELVISSPSDVVQEGAAVDVKMRQ
jgi:hypothetical protein